MYLWFFKERNYKIVLSLFCVLIIVVFIANGGGVYIEGAANNKQPAKPAAAVTKPAAAVTKPAAAVTKPAAAVTKPAAAVAKPAAAMSYSPPLAAAMSYSPPPAAAISYPPPPPAISYSPPPPAISYPPPPPAISYPPPAAAISYSPPPAAAMSYSPPPPAAMSYSPPPPAAISYSPPPDMRINPMEEIQSIVQQNPKIDEISNYIQNDIISNIILQNVNINIPEIYGNTKIQAIQNNLINIVPNYSLRCIKYVNDSMSNNTYNLDSNYNTNITSCINNVNKFIMDNNISTLLLNKDKIYFNLFNPNKTDLNNSIISNFIAKYKNDFGGEGNATIIIKGVFNLLFQMINEITAL